MRHSEPRELAPSELRRTCDPAKLGFETTADLEPLTQIFGQPRVAAAFDFGTEIGHEGYNIFAFGPPGTGKHRIVKDALAPRAAAIATPPDICYVNNFDDPRAPMLLTLPAGRGAELREDLRQLIDELGTSLRVAFEGDAYQNRRQLLEEELKEKQDHALSGLGEEARQAGLALLRTPMGIVFAPVGDEDVISAEEFEKLDAAEKKELEEKIENFQGRLQKLFRQFPRWQREARRRALELNREVSSFTVGPLIADLKQKYAELETVVAYLEAVEKDVVENARALIPRGDEKPGETQRSAGDDAEDAERPFTSRYRVNVLVDHSETGGAPIVYEDNPTYANLLGRVEHFQHMGALSTDFNLVKGGALHRANGGYLMVDAVKVLTNPFAWEGLKRALQSQQIKIESLGQALSLVSTYSLEPEPLDLSVKVVLIGPPILYYLLAHYDSDFPRLFKVPADFSEQMDASVDNLELFARFIARSVREDELKPFDATAVASIVEDGSRRLGDAEKLSLYTSQLRDFLKEADFFASRAGDQIVTARHVEEAIAARIHRSDRIRERMQEEVLRGTILVDTEGSAVGQINGLAVLQLGDFMFGKPSRITARVRLGKGEVVDIEREVELSGPLHSKGVLILGGFLGARYAADRPLSLAASLVFEQSYGGVDGDSASSAELYALLSAISGVPLRQDLAVTGSVNQLGRVQAIGGVTQKIEGFFDLCDERGLTGSQGVLIPTANVKHLMLKKQVVDAVAEGRFHVYPVETIDEGIAILTGREAGTPDRDGKYPEGSVNSLVEQRLAELAERARSFSTRGKDE
jgi:lon-related putative ATP-dependent protease